MAIEILGLSPLIQVYDMPASLAFYRDILGFEVHAASPERDTPEGRFSHWMWLKRGDAELMLNTAFDEGERPPARDAARDAAHGDVALYLGCRDLDSAWRELQAQGVRCDAPKTTGYGMRQLNLKDPDGYGICLQWPAG